MALIDKNQERKEVERKIQMEKQAELDLIKKKKEEEAMARRRYSPQNHEVLHDILSETEDEDGKEKKHPVSVAINLSKL